MVSIFLSYARNDDEAFVRRLHADLTAAGFDVWFDRVSMPSRQLTFHQEIRDAIAARDRLLLVIGPGAIASDYVTQEWRFAYFEAGKCVNPIVRLNDRGADGAVIDGYELIPEDLRLLHAEDFRPNANNDAHYDTHLANLIRQLSEALPPVGKLVAVPELPAHFVSQPDRIRALRDILLADLSKPVVVSGAAGRVGLQGMGGIGKSVLAAALAHHPEVRRAFPDGVYWVALGQQPVILELQKQLLHELGDDSIFTGIEPGKQKLREALSGRAALLILDDVWERSHAEAFNVVGARCRLLLTTRDAGLVTALAANENHYQVQLPTMAEAESLLAHAARISGPLPPEARSVIEQCGRLPLALALCGGMMASGVSGAYLLEALREHDLEYLSTNAPAEEQHRSIWKAMDVSVRALPEDQRVRFAELAVFAADTGAPEAAVVTLWQHTSSLSPRHTNKLLADLAARSLVEYTPAKPGESGGHLRLHDLLHLFGLGMAEKQFGSLAALHQRLLDAYEIKCSGTGADKWPTGPNDCYFFEHLCEHLIAADKLDEAIELLTDIPWLEAKCKVKLVLSLQEDYRVVIDAMPEAQESLRQERERQARLDRWTREFTEYAQRMDDRGDCIATGETVSEPELQVPEPPPSAHIWRDEEIQAEHNRIRQKPTLLDRVKLFADFIKRDFHLLLQFGERDGFVVQHAYNSAPEGPVHAAGDTLLPKYAVPMLVCRWTNADVWNTIPILLRELDGHKRPLTCGDVTPDGRRAITGDADGTLRVWDLETGSCVLTLEGHDKGIDKWIDKGIREVAISPDGQHAASYSLSGSVLDWWDLGSGTCLHGQEMRLWRLIPEDSEAFVHGMVLTGDGQSVIFQSWDQEAQLAVVKVWTPKSGECLEVSACRGFYLIKASAGGQRAIRRNEDKKLEVWNPNTCEPIRMLEGPVDSVEDISISLDGRLAVGRYGDGKMHIWDLEKGSCLRTMEGCGHSGFIKLTGDGRRAVLNLGNSLLVWNLENGKSIRTLDGYQEIEPRLIAMRDGRYAVSQTFGGAMRVWDLDRGETVRTLNVHRSRAEICVNVTSDGRRALSGGADGSLRVWDLETGVCLRTLIALQVPIPIYCCAVTPDDRHVIAGTAGGVIFLDLETGVLLGELNVKPRKNSRTDKIMTIAITEDGRRALCGTDLGRLLLSDSSKSKRLRELKGHTECITCVAVTEQGRRAISGSSDSTLRVWDVETGACLLTLEGHSEGITCLTLAGAGKQAVSASLDKTIRVWDLGTGACLQTLVADVPVSTFLHVDGETRTLGLTHAGYPQVATIHNAQLNAAARHSFIDTNASAYEVVLRRGLDFSLRKRGTAHEETEAHRTALAALLRRMGREAEAHAVETEQ
jgi:WD40 repeat protein